MTTPALDVMTFVSQDGEGFAIGGTDDWSLFLAFEPAAPLNCISFFDLSGGAPLTDQQDLLNVRVQVRVRAQNYNIGYGFMEDIRSNLLDFRPPALMNGNVYLGWSMESDIWSLGRNNSNQFLLVSNFTSIKQRVIS